MAHFIRLIGFAIAIVIGVGIAFVCLDARDTGLVAVWLDVARFFTDPFTNLVDLERDSGDLQTAINWGLAAALYLLAALLISRALVKGRAGRRALR